MSARLSIPRRWRNSLYARAVLFIALGAGAVAGAVFMLARVLMQDSVDRLLGERMELARTAGALLEDAIHHDLAEIARKSGPLLAAEPPDAGALRRRLAEEYGHTLFSDGAFFLAPDCRPLAAVPEAATDFGDALDLPALCEEAARRGIPVASSLVHLAATHRPTLVLLAPVREGPRLVGYAGGLLQPAATNVLAVLAEGRTRTGFDLVDSRGVVVGSTDEGVLFQTSDHDNLLTRAIARRTEIRGRCHSCHETGDDEAPVRRTEILAFAPLPTLDLGLAVHQPEAEALAPAFAVRRRIYRVGVAFLALFLTFTMLAVQSVVRPINRLTREVKRLDAGDARPIPHFGHDEVGLLARALERWRRRVARALDAEERQRRALTDEIESTRRRLDALEDIVVRGTRQADIHGALDLGLARLVEALGAHAGAIELYDGRQAWWAACRLPERAARAALDQVRELLPPISSARSGNLRLRRPKLLPYRPVDEVPYLARFGRWTAAIVPAARGVCMRLVLAEPDGGVDERWLRSLLQHLATVAGNLWHRAREHEVEVQRQAYLHRVLRAQEDERRRVARELHDTLAQDLAALRLEVERLGSRSRDPVHRAELSGLEQRIHEMLLNVRSILLDLRLPLLEDIGLLGTVRWQLDRVRRTHGVRAVLTVDGEERPIPYELAVPLFRIVQESVQNAINHGGSAHVFVNFAFEDEALELSVEDDGEGFDVAAVTSRPPAPDGRGLGLLGMKERAHLLGGTLSIESTPGEGTSLVVRVPLPGDGVTEETAEVTAEEPSRSP